MLRIPRLSLSILQAAMLTLAIVALMLLVGLRPSPAGAVAYAGNINSNPTPPACSSGPPPDQPQIALPDGYTPSYPKVGGVSDAAGPTTWRVLLLVYRNTDVDYVEGGVTKHMTTSMSQAEIDKALARFDRFKQYVADYSAGEANIDATVVHVSRPVSSLTAIGSSYWLSPNDVRNELNTYAPRGAYDSVEALWQSCSSSLNTCIPPFGWGSSVSASDWSNGATYASMIFGWMWWWDWEADSAQLYLHEWLHGAMDFYSSLGHVMPVGGLDSAGEHGYTKSPVDSWATWYRAVMTGQVWEPSLGRYVGITPAVWRSGPIIRYTISGRVTNSSGGPIGGAVVSDDAGHTATTDSSGNYSLTDVPAGTYSLTAAKTGWFALPISREVTVPPSAAGVTFVMLDDSAGCGAFGKMANGEPLPSGVTANQIRQVFITACQRVSSVGNPLNAVHWWQGLLVQDYLSRDGQERGAIFYDANVHQGDGQAYVLWGPVLQRYWSNFAWGPPQSDREPALQSPYKTNGHLVRFSDLDVYYNDKTKGTYVVRGVTRDRFNVLQGTAGFLGFPKGEGVPAAASGFSGVSGTYQQFEGGLMHTFAPGGVWQAWEVHGAIQAAYNSLPGVGSGSPLGFPISGEQETEASPVDTRGFYQRFEGGRIYYDSTDSSGKDVGVTFVLYHNTARYLPESSSGVDDHRLGFPIDRQQSPEDCRVFFELGYIDCGTGIHEYGEGASGPNLPDLWLPYVATAEVYWSGGPHGYGAGTGVKTIPTGVGSGIDFANSGDPSFEVRAMTNGTVVEVVNGTDAACSSGLGCRIGIRSDNGGTILVYSHLKADSLLITRKNESTGQQETKSVTKGMYIFAGEKIGIAGKTGTADIHLHVEFRDGTGRQNASYNYTSTTGRRFGYPVDWEGPDISGYRLFNHREPGKPAVSFNYDGSAVRDADNQTQRLRGHYIDPVFGRTLADLTVHQTFECAETDWDCEAIDGNGLTEFAGKGCLGGGCAARDSSTGADGDVAAGSWTGGRLISNHNGTVVSFDPNIVTLESPNYGYPEQTHQIFLPVVAHDMR